VTRQHRSRSSAFSRNISFRNCPCFPSHKVHFTPPKITSSGERQSDAPTKSASVETRAFERRIRPSICNIQRASASRSILGSAALTATCSLTAYVLGNDDGRPLGSGLSQAVGMALADRIDRGRSRARFIYCLMPLTISRIRNGSSLLAQTQFESML
jgi:hypothetical protein